MSTHSVHSIQGHAITMDDSKSEKALQKSVMEPYNDAASVVSLSLDNSKVEKMLNIFALMGTFSAAIKISIMSLANDMHVLDQDKSGEATVLRIYQIFLFGFTADLLVASLSMGYIMFNSLGRAGTWPSWLGKTLGAVLYALCAAGMGTASNLTIEITRAGGVSGKHVIYCMAIPYGIMYGVVIVGIV
ncbi:unnamed protein product, partial [Rhizoctonia solani]